MSHSLWVDQLAERLQQIRQTLPPTVKLIAVTKQVPVAAMRVAYELGIRDFGENRVQEAADKQIELADLTDLTWHLIGHLQSNKAAKALDLFDWIHSVDSLKLAQQLNRLAAHRSCPPKICLQVKILPDPNKSGWTIDDLLADLPELDHCTNLDIAGLMAIPPYGLPAAETQAVFERTRQLSEQIQQQSWSHIHLRELSMGMSEDYFLAVQAGSTMVRLGRTFFGSREKA